MKHVQLKQTVRLRRLYTGCLLLLVVAACSSAGAPEAVENEITVAEPQPLINSGTRNYWWSPTENQVLFHWQVPDMGAPGLLADGPLLLLDIPSGATQRLPQTGSMPLWSPAGDALIWRSGNQLDGTLQFWHYTPASAVLQPLQPSSFGMPTQWLNDGRMLYTKPGELWLGTIDTKTNTLSEPVHWVDLNSMGVGRIPWQHVSPAGNAVFFLAGRPMANSGKKQHILWLLPLDRAGNPQVPQALTSAPDGIGFCCRWSADGQFLAFAAFTPEHGIYLVEMGNVQEPALVVSAAALGEGHFISMDFAPDNRQLVFEWSPLGDGFPFAETELYLVNLAGEETDVESSAEQAVETGNRPATPQRLTAPGSGSHNWVRWSPQANFLTFQRESDGEQRTWIMQLSWATGAQTTTSLKPAAVDFAATVPTVDTGEAAGVALAAGFQRTTESHCPSGAPLAPPVQWQTAPHTTLEYRQEIASVFMRGTPESWSTADIPLRRRQAQSVDLGISSLLKQDERIVGIQVGYYAKEIDAMNVPLHEITPGLYLHGMFAELIAPVLVRAPAEVVTTPTGLTCWPAEVTTVNHYPAILLRQQAASAEQNAYNHLIWREERVYWRLSAPDRSAGGEYSADDLQRIAETELEEYDPVKGLWQP